MFIITVLNVQTKIVSILRDRVFKDKKSALTTIFQHINSQSEKAYINKIKNNQYIEVYKVLKGSLWDSKELIHIYQILPINNKKSNTNEESKTNHNDNN